MNVLNTITKLLAVNSIDEECSALYQKAIELIKAKEVASDIFCEFIDELPMLSTGTYNVAVKDNEHWITKEQAWNDALWLVSISLLCEFGSLNSHVIETALFNWSREPENCTSELNTDTCVWMSEAAIIQMQACGWLETFTQTDITELAGKPVTVKRFPQTTKFIDVYQFNKALRIERLSMKCQPLTHKPTAWTDNTTGVGEKANLRLIKGYTQKIVPSHVLKAANIAQSVAFEVHPDMHELACIVADNTAAYQKILGVSDNDKWDGQVEQWKAIADLQINTPYWFPVTYDFRGRLYYRGGWVSPQGADCAKAAFVFHRGLPLGRMGFPALCMALASAMGSKESGINKVHQVEQQLEQLIAYSADFIQFCKRFPKADYCQAWLLTREIGRAVAHKQEHGKFDTFVSNVPCHQDATCSGLQHIAIMTKDLKTAYNTNMTPSSWSDTPQDVYGVVASATNHKWVQEVGKRDICKLPVMTGAYGASEGTVAKKLTAKLKSKYNMAYDESILEAMTDAMRIEIPALESFTKALRTRAVAALEAGATEFTWQAYDGFPVKHQYINNNGNLVRGKSYSAVMNRHERLLDHRKMETAFSPNFVHTQDSCHLRSVTVTSRVDLVLVHDSFGSHACNFYHTNQVLRTCIVDIYTSYQPLHDLAERNAMRPIKFQGEYDIATAIDAMNICG